MRRLYKKKCLECGVTFYPFHRLSKFCSNKCSAVYKSKKSWYKRKCKKCGKLFFTRKKRNQFYCSRKCYIEQKQLTNVLLTCLICGKKFTVKYSVAKNGRKYCSRKCLGVAHSIFRTGKNNHRFIDGKSKERNIKRDQCRNTIQYKNFIRQVFIRDTNICQICGVKRKRIKNGKGKNNNLTVHHIKSWLNYPKLRYNIKNGIVLCAECHRNIHRKSILKNIIDLKKSLHLKECVL